MPEFAVVPGLYAAGTAAATTEVRGGYVAGWSNTRAIALAHRAVAHVSEGTS